MQSTLPRVVLRYRRLLIVAIHLALVPAGFVGAFLVRFDFDPPPHHFAACLATLPWMVVIRMAAFWWFGLFRGYWQHFSMHDLLLLTKATTLSTAVFVAVLWPLGALVDMPRSVLILDWLLAIFLTGGVHFAARCAREGRLPVRAGAPGRRTLVIGAGAAAERFLREALRERNMGIRPIGLVDDEPSKQHRLLHGVPVLGGVDDLARIVARYRIDLLVIAIPSATRQEMQRIVQSCLETKLEFRAVRPIAELLDGRTRIGQLRNVQVEDLLGRPPVCFEDAAAKAIIAESVVLVTGGAGSIGSELARQIAALGPARLVLYEQAESPLYYVEADLRRAYPELELAVVVGDITDERRLEAVFARHRPRYVFHAAAYKHVPMMEANVLEAVRNNVFGTLYVARAAVRHGTDAFVLLSTDKAVYPSSVMGATKRIAERIILSLPELRGARTDFRAVRFGNVLGSDGSVLPLFRRQLARGGPLTVTHPSVTRYFMTVQEAAQLVLQAAMLPEVRGRIAMLDMGAPVPIVELAENLIHLSGLQPHADVQIQFTGLRPGEKLHEDLMAAFEHSVPTTATKIRVVEREETDGDGVHQLLVQLAAAYARGDTEETLVVLRALVPECVSPLRERTVDTVPSLMADRGVSAPADLTFLRLPRDTPRADDDFHPQPVPGGAH